MIQNKQTPQRKLAKISQVGMCVWRPYMFVFSFRTNVILYSLPAWMPLIADFSCVVLAIDGAGFCHLVVPWLCVFTWLSLYFTAHSLRKQMGKHINKINDCLVYYKCRINKFYCH